MKKIGIIGRGLIGGSIFKGLSSKPIFLSENWIEELDQIDFLILATPLSVILEIGEKLSHIKRKTPLIVVDVGSVKGIIQKKFEEWTNETMEFVATHPMAGKEKSGYEESDGSLFQKSTWVIVPHRKNREETLQVVEGIVGSLGAYPLRMNGEEHDRRAALVSQLPYILSKTLLSFVDEEAQQMGGPGFRSMVRLALDNPEMRREINRYNRKNILRALEGYIELLKKEKI